MSLPWSEPEKTSLRMLLGYPRVFTQYDSRMEQAINSVQTLDRSSDMDAIRLCLGEIASLDPTASSLLCDVGIYSVGNGVTIDSDVARQILMIERRVRQLIRRIAVLLGANPIRDYYTGDELEGAGDYGNSPWMFQGT